MLEVRNLTKRFKTEHMFSAAGGIITAVDNVSFTVERGKILAIVGESGSGKTTIARCIAGLETPDSGEMLFEGNPVFYGTKEARRSIQYVFQDTFSSLNPRMRVGSIVGEPIKFHFRLEGASLAEETENYLKMTGLSNAIINKYPHELSGGQRQRVVIARALTMRPVLLIADEPVSSLDVSVQAQVLSLFKKLNKEGNISIIFITHDLRIVKNLADGVIVLHDGRVMEEGSVERVFARPEADYTRLLLSSIPDSPYKKS